MLDGENPAEDTTATAHETAPAEPGTAEAPTPDSAPEEAPAKKAAAKKTAKKAAAKKATAKKTPAKKTAKKAAKKSTSADAAPGEETLALDLPVPAGDADQTTPAAGEVTGIEATTVEGGAEAEAAPAKKTSKKAPAKKAPAKKAPAKKAAAKKATTKKAAAKKAAAEPAAEDGAAADQPTPVPLADEPAGAGDESAAAVPAAPVPLFQPPKATRKTTSRRRKPAEEATEPTQVPAEDEAATKAGVKRTEAEPEPQDESEEEQQGAEGEREDEGQGGSGRRRRRRGGRRRRRSGDADATDEETTDEAADEKPDKAEKAEKAETEPGEGTTSSRRRRRRRRSGEEGEPGSDEPENTVTRVRKPRNPEDEITALSGSTRLEAKKQRRREGREAGRRRAPIVSEAEFLARREAVDRVMVIRQRKDLTQIAVLEDKVLVEHYVARESQTSLIGNVYLGRVQNVLPSMEAAFIDIGKGRNAVLYAGEVNWDALGAGNGPRKIEQVLKSGQSVLVQVTKDPVGHKGARLTSQISLPGRFLVYVPDGTTSGISRKLPDTERNRLKTLLKEIVPDTAGVIVRTAAEGASEEELTRDVERLTARWEDISAKVAKGNAPQLLYGEPDLTLKVVRDLFTEDFGRLVVSGDDAWDMVDSYVGHVAPDLADRLERFDGEEDVFAAYRIDEQIAKALDRKVWLPSGGSLIIDRTEAMTVVDVNTGKFTGSGGNLEETVTKNNLEAAEEIVRQLRLRDIGGIIVVDFIDMVLESNRDLVLRRLVECLGRDRTRHQVAEVTSLGLVQMTRKRIGTGLLEAFSESCEQCQGRGLVIHHEPVEPKKKQEEEPRRGRRSRGGRKDEAPAGGQPAAAPSPKEIAAMAKASAGTKEGTGAEERPAEPSAAAAESEAPAEAPTSTEQDRGAAEQGSTRPAARSRRRSTRTRAGDDRESVPETAAEETAPEPATEPAPSEPAPSEPAPSDPAVAELAVAEPVPTGSEPTDEAPEQPPAAPEQPTVRTTTRARRGSSRREAGPPAATSAPVTVVVPPAPEPAAAEEIGEAAGEPAAAPRVVTTSRRRVARRPAGPPVGAAAANGAGSAPEIDGADDEGASDEAMVPAEAGGATAHVPVKKKGSRKR